jgi:tetratricopeptide (TPR) repeat protein
MASPGASPRFIVPALLALLLIPALLIGIRRGRADFRFTSARSAGEIEAACRLDPGRAACLAALARVREESAMEAAPVWSEVLALNPRNASYLAQAALAAEFRGELHTAERLLLRSARYNQLWLPRWSLANFYYRHQRWDEFRRWAALALGRAHGDRTALFRLCSSAGLGSGELLGWMRDHHENLAAYVRFLALEGSDAALPAAATAYAEALPAGLRHPAEQSVLAEAINALLARERIEAVPPLWSRLAERRLIPYPAWSEARPLVNPRFAPLLPGGGLDWRLERVPGVEAFVGVPPGGIKFTFSGRQPEEAELLAQPLLLRGGQTWLLEFEFQTPGISPAASSLSWRLGGRPPDQPPAPVAADDWTRVIHAWTLPPGFHLQRLALRSQRPRGQARHEGELRIRRLEFKPALQEAQP